MVTKAQAGTSTRQNDNLLTVKQVREIWPEKMRCGNCRNVDRDLMWSSKCEQLLCPECRRRRTRTLRTITAAVRVERNMGYYGLVVKGTHYPADFHEM